MDLLAPSPATWLFAGVTDPRVERTRRHLLGDLLLLALCATLAGAESFADMEDWARTKEGWLRTFLELPGGIPSHDTFERVFRRFNPKELHVCFLRWLESTANLVGEGRHIAIDGKSLRGSFDGPGGRALHVVSAFATGEFSLVLGQVAVKEIKEADADYVLALKGNHPLLHADAQRLFADEATLAEMSPARAETLEKDHGRIETRRCVALTDAG